MDTMHAARISNENEMLALRQFWIATASPNRYRDYFLKATALRHGLIDSGEDTARKRRRVQSPQCEIKNYANVIKSTCVQADERYLIRIKRQTADPDKYLILFIF